MNFSLPFPHFEQKFLQWLSYMGLSLYVRYMGSRQLIYLVSWIKRNCAQKAIKKLKKDYFICCLERKGKWQVLNLKKKYKASSLRRCVRTVWILDFILKAMGNHSLIGSRREKYSDLCF